MFFPSLPLEPNKNNYTKKYRKKSRLHSNTNVDIDIDMKLETNALLKKKLLLPSYSPSPSYDNIMYSSGDMMYSSGESSFCSSEINIEKKTDKIIKTSLMSNNINEIINEFADEYALILYLSDYDLHKIPHKLLEFINNFTFSNVKCIFFENNNLSDLGEIDFEKLEALEMLNLSYNNFCSLPKEIKNLKKLKEINLSGNKFTEIPKILYEIKSLKNIHIINCKFIDKFNFTQDLELTIHIDNNPNLFDIWKIISYRYINIKINWNDAYPNKVINNLYIGSILSTQHEYIYKYYNIKYVFSIQKELKPIMLDGMINYSINLDDSDNSKLFFCDKTANSLDIDILHECLQKGVCLVHCVKGISRSASFVIAYLIKYYNMTYDDAYDYLKNKRSCIDPNKGFVKQLREFEKNLKKN